MKRLPPRRSCSGTGDNMIRLSRSEVQTLIQQEIQRTMKDNERKLQGLIETIQQLDCGIDYESSIQKLEARIDAVAKRAEALVLVTNTEQKNPVLSVPNVDMIKAETKETVSQVNESSLDCIDKNGELFHIMERTKKALQKIRAGNEAVSAAITDLSEDLSPPVLTSNGSPKFKEHLRLVKKEPEDTKEKANTQELEEVKEPQAKRIKVERVSPDRSNIPKDADSPEKTLSYPPLPSSPFPTVLNMEAASYNIPQRPEVHVALIRDPPGLSVLWKVEKEDPSAAPMESYSVYVTTEKVKGSGVFPAWKIIGEVRAITLPMCVLIKKYKPGHRLCVAVVGKDVYNRYGPYSKVVTAAIPD